MARRNAPSRFNGNGVPTPGLNNSLAGNVGGNGLPVVKPPRTAKPTSTGPNYDYVHPAYSARAPQWQSTRAAVEGYPAISLNFCAFLPDPTPTDQCAEARARYSAYCARATYFNATGRTKNGLVGIAFGEWPEVEVPASMEYVKENLDGAGAGIYQMSQNVVGEILETGRGGLLADYPNMGGAETTVAAQRQGVAARLVWYKTEDIRDWNTEKVGPDVKLSYVKLYEQREVRSEDGWSMQKLEVYRILRLRNVGGTWTYTVELFEKLDSGWTSTGEITPTDAAGKPWDVIPFQFVGAEDNGPSPNKPPLYDLAHMNLAHFRNSADFEESVFMLGQPQVTMTGIDETWRDHIEKSGVYFGSRRVLMGPQNAQIGLLQVQPNTLAQVAMKDKKDEMVALGARLLQPGSTTKTAEQSKSETRAAYSVLSLACDNVSMAFKQGLLWVQRFMGAAGDLDFAIDTEFNGMMLNTELVNAVIKAAQAGLIPESEVWRLFKTLGLIDPEKTDEEIREEIDATTESALQMQAALGMPAGPAAPPGGGKKPAAE